MKKLIYCALALATGLFAASCQQENLEPVQGGNTVTFEVSVPEVATKGIVDDGSNINDLVYAVYWTEAESLLQLQESPELQSGLKLLYKKNYTVDPFKGTGRTTVNVELLNDKNYIVLFWAQVSETWVAGNNFDLMSVSYPANMQANSNNYAAFSGVSFISKNNLSGKKDVTLKRPFAQLNIGTTLPNDKTGEEHNFDVAISKTSVKVKNAGTSFNLIKQVAEGNATVDAPVVFAEAAAPKNPDGTDVKLVVNNIPYTYAAMNYVFANGNVEVDYVIDLGEYHGTVKNTVSNVPVAANYRTNIIGNLLTGTTEYNVVLDEFDTNNNSGDIEVITEGLVKNQNGDYEISTDNGLIHAINNLWVDKHGVANPKTFYVYPQEYNITDEQIKDVVVTSGTLKVIKDKPVMTRSSGIDGIVIKGLSKPLIASVGEDATVVISGVTIQTSEDNDEQVAALIGENDGKVIIENCKVIDENDAPDTTTELIGDNNGTVTELENVDEGEVGEVGVVYDAVQLAAAFANAEIQNIVLGANIAVEETLIFPKDRTATLDLKGFKLTIAGNEEKVSSTYVINNHGTLTIKDSYDGVGAVNACGIYNGYVADGEPIATAKLIIEGGNFNAKGTNGGSAVFNYGVAEINGGKFTGYVALNNQPGGKMTINAANITEKTDKYAVQNHGGEMTINDVDLTQGIGHYSGTLTVKDGKIHTTREGSSHAIYVGGGEINIYGGDFMGNGNEVINSNSYTANIYGGTFTKDPNGKTSYLLAGTNMTIYGGTFNAHASNPTGHPVRHDVTVMGGTFNYNPQGQNKIPEGYLSVANDNDTWTVRLGMAKVNKTAYTTFQDAIDAVKDGETVTLLSDCNEDVTFTQTPDKSFELDGAEHTMTGTIKIIPRAGTDGNVSLAIKNFNFVTSEESKDFINASETNYYPRNLTVSDCTFEGPGANSSVVAVRIKMGSTFTMENCSATNLHSLFQNGRGGWNYTIKNCTLTNASEGISLNSVQNALVESVNVSNNGYGLRINAAYATTTTVKNCIISSFIPVVVREASADHILVFEGTNTMTASNTDNLWCAIGTDAYTTNGTMPSAATGKVTVDLKDEGLTTAGIYGAYWPPVAKVGSTEYGTIDDAIANWTNNTTLTLLRDVELSDVVTLKSTEHHTLNLGTYTMTAASGKNAIEITCNGRSSASYALTVNADAINPGGITATGKACIYYKKSDSTKDRPIILINNGVFTGSYSINSTSDGNTNCPQVWINGGVFNSYMNLTKNLLKVTGGTFHAAINCTGDQSAYRHIQGGRFKSWQFMTADASTKFWVGTAKETYDVGVYVDDEGYLVVGGEVISDYGTKYEAKVNHSKWSSFLKYSSAKDNGLYCTSAEYAIKKWGSKNVEVREDVQNLLVDLIAEYPEGE